MRAGQATARSVLHGNRAAYGLMAGFAVVIACLVFLALYATARTEEMHLDHDTLQNLHGTRIDHAYRMRMVVRDRMIAMQHMVLEDDHLQREQAYHKYLELANVYMRSREFVREMTQDEHEHADLQRLDILTSTLTPLNDQVVELALGEQHDQARGLLLREALPSQQQVLLAIDNILQRYQENSQLFELRAHKNMERTLHLFWLLAIVLISVSVLIAIYTVRRVQHDRRVLVSAFREAQAQRHQAQHDPLTGLLNRAGLYEQMHHAINSANSADGELALMLLDMDGFKAINDTHGHEAGDAAIVTLARLLEDCKPRHGDIVARLAGDEFVMILDVTGRPGLAEEVAEKIRARLANGIRADGEQAVLSVSIGIALYPGDANTGAALLHCADLAMYRVKQSGKDGYGYFSRENNDGNAHA